MAVNITGLNNKVTSPKSTNEATSPTIKAPVTPEKSVVAPAPKPVVPAVTVAIKSAVVAAPKPPVVVVAKAPVAPVVSKPAAAVSKPVVAAAVKAPVAATKPVEVAKAKSVEVAKAPAVVAKPVAAKAATPATTVSVNKSKPEVDTYNKSGNVANSNALSKSSSISDTGGFIAGKGDVVIDIKNSDSGYENKIYYSTDNFKTKNYVGIDNKTGSVNIGSFKEGTKIEFGIENGVKQFFKTGDASANFDNFKHTQTTELSDGAVQIGFEDLAGGGDKDFNDAIIQVRNVPSAKTNDNRSGLGDGTNPGQGGGKVNSPNQGTNNPSSLNL